MEMEGIRIKSMREAACFMNSREGLRWPDRQWKRWHLNRVLKEAWLFLGETSLLSPTYLIVPQHLSPRDMSHSVDLRRSPVFLLLNLPHALLQGEAPSPTCLGEGKQEVTEAPISRKREGHQTFTEKSLVAATLLPEVGGKATCRDR